MKNYRLFFQQALIKVLTKISHPLLLTTMVVNNLTRQIMTLGFSEYEARAYECLLKIQPATAYEISRESGIPSSKIYEVIAKLTDKKIFILLDGSAKKKNYFATPPGEFIESRKSFFDKTFNALEKSLPKLEKETDISCVWNFNEYGFFLEKAERMIFDASETILLSTWGEEFEALSTELKEAEKKGVKIATVHFGETEKKTGQIFRHPIMDTIYEEKGGRGFTLVTDSGTALVATIKSDDAVEGAWSSNQGFITLAEDYIKHDIYIMKIVARFDETLLGKFGDNYHCLRDIFNDREV